MSTKTQKIIHAFVQAALALVLVYQPASTSQSPSRLYLPLVAKAGKVFIMNWDVGRSMFYQWSVVGNIRNDNDFPITQVFYEAQFWPCEGEPVTTTGTTTFPGIPAHAFSPFQAYFNVSSSIQSCAPPAIRLNGWQAEDPPRHVPLTVVRVETKTNPFIYEASLVLRNDNATPVTNTQFMIPEYAWWLYHEPGKIEPGQVFTTTPINFILGYMYPPISGLAVAEAWQP